MERTTYLRVPEGTELKHPDKWSSMVRKFQQATQVMDLAALKNVSTQNKVMDAITYPIPARIRQTRFSRKVFEAMGFRGDKSLPYKLGNWCGKAEPQSRANTEEDKTIIKYGRP